MVLHYRCLYVGFDVHNMHSLVLHLLLYVWWLLVVIYTANCMVQFVAAEPPRIQDSWCPLDLFAAS